jgi:hypothetical protein
MSQSMPEFLAWVARRPRTYAETMEAWQTSCPRNSVWEDALGDGLIHLADGVSRPTGQAAVTLTPQGRALLDGTHKHSDSARALELEERGHALRRKMASRPYVLASIQAGREAEERGELIPIEQLDRVPTS